jgi:hypothetical protein
MFGATALGALALVAVVRPWTLPDLGDGRDSDDDVDEDALPAAA